MNLSSNKHMGSYLLRQRNREEYGIIILKSLHCKLMGQSVDALMLSGLSKSERTHPSSTLMLQMDRQTDGTGWLDGWIDEWKG